MTDEGTDDMLDNDDGQRQPDRKGPYRMDAVSVSAGLLFIAIAILALADRFWAEVDPVLVGGGVAVAVGVVMMGARFKVSPSKSLFGVIRRGRREREPIDG